MRHLKCMYGQSFYASSSSSSSSSSAAASTSSSPFDLNKLNLSLTNTTYIEAITLVLLFYIRSYYPPSRFTLLLPAAPSASSSIDPIRHPSNTQHRRVFNNHNHNSKS